MNRHFHMICIRDKFSQNIGRQVPSKVIWDHLSTMYDMQALVSQIPPKPRHSSSSGVPLSCAHPRGQQELNRGAPVVSLKTPALVTVAGFRSRTSFTWGDR